ncbi:MAG: hypothetical protein ACT4OO_14585 [Nitrospiraceae bacterium]
MMRRDDRSRASLLIVTVSGLLFACAGAQHQQELDLIETTLPLPLERVRTAVVDVLTTGGYTVKEDESRHLTTGYRDETSGPWDWLLRWRFGTTRSRVDATLTPEEETATHLKILVTHEDKDGLFTAWEESPTALPQSAANQLRLIKNELKLL